MAPPTEVQAKAQRRLGRRRQQQQQQTTTTRRTPFKGHRPEILQQSSVWINGSPKPLRELITIIITKLAAWQEFTLPCRLFIQVHIFLLWQQVRSLTRRSLPRGLRVSETNSYLIAPTTQVSFKFMAEPFSISWKKYLAASITWLEIPPRKFSGFCTSCECEKTSHSNFNLQNQSTAIFESTSFIIVNWSGDFGGDTVEDK